MAFEEFKNYCPECGAKIKNRKVATGRFRCSKCNCEYVRHWRTWLIVGIPWLAFFLWMIGSVAYQKFPGRGPMYLCAGICVLILFLAPNEYRVVKHGDDYDEFSKQNDDA